LVEQQGFDSCSAACQLLVEFAGRNFQRLLPKTIPEGVDLIAGDHPHLSEPANIGVAQFPSVFESEEYVSVRRNRVFGPAHAGHVLEAARGAVAAIDGKAGDAQVLQIGQARGPELRATGQDDAHRAVVARRLELLDDGLAYVKEGSKVFENPGGAEGLANVPGGMEEAVIESAEECPGECIFIEVD